MFEKRAVVVERENLENVVFTNKRNPREGIASFAMGIATIAVFLAMGIAATAMDGNGLGWFGLVGCLMGAVNAFAITKAVKALKMEDVYHTFTIWGLAINAVALLGYAAIYIWGLFLR